MKTVFRTLGIFLAISISLQGILFLLAQRAGIQHKESVIINSSQQQVWDYLSENHHAKMWSVFFDHITTLPSSSSEIKEGGIGSIRRCFRRPDETGIRWDEVTVQSQAPVFRQIHTYNIQNWPYADFNKLEFNVYQQYEKIDVNTTKLSFVTDLKTPLSAYAKWMFYMAQFETKRVFKLNLENIKAHIEQQQSPDYDRPHAYEAQTYWEKYWPF